MSDQLPSNLVTVYPARSEGLVAVGNWAEHHPYPIERYPPDLRDIEVLNKRLQTLASARCDEFLENLALMFLPVRISKIFVKHDYCPSNYLRR